MQTPGGPEEDPTGGFYHGGWSVNYWDEATGAAMAETFSTPLRAAPRKTYEIFAAHWSHVGRQERAERGETTSDVDDDAASTTSATSCVALSV